MAIGTQASVHYIEDVLISEVSTVRGSTVVYKNAKQISLAEVKLELGLASYTDYSLYLQT